MKSFLTFDYELFFGSHSGSIEKCMIEPTNELIKIAGKNNAQLIFFVDAGYILGLQEYSKKYPKLNKDYTLLQQQLASIIENGHDIQLHIHPHWKDSYYDGEKWVFDTTRYKLSDFEEIDVLEICKNYKATLNEFSDDVFAYRAGGWCIQPFQKISEGLKKCGVWLDSTIYQEGLNLSHSKGFDFRGAPKDEFWRFEENPLKKIDKGFFLELPINSVSVSPWIYWKVAFNKLFSQPKHRSIGDGNSLSSGNTQTIKLLIKKSNQPVFLDGIKSDNLIHAYRWFEKQRQTYFTAIGHPKAMSPFSFRNLSRLMQMKNSTFVSYTKVKKELQQL